MLPLFFQVVLLDSATTAGARLAIPSLATPIGGLIAGIVMSKWGKLTTLVRTGAVLMTFGNALVTSLSFYDTKWKYLVYIFPANLGQGIIYPATLFTTLASFEHAGTWSRKNLLVRPADEIRIEHAVSASTVYLIRSLGSVWGVAITASIVQNTLSWRLPAALAGVPDRDQVRPQSSTPPEQTKTDRRHRSSKTSGTQSPRCAICHRRSSSRPDWCITTVFGTRSRRRRGLLLLASLPVCLFIILG
jgi:hypothetical protein